MGLGRTWSVALHGVEGHVVEVEAHIGDGMNGVHMVGLADTALRESKDRVRAAIVNSGCSWPQRRLVLSLSPATLRKSGSAFDLALALAVLGAQDVVTPDSLTGTALLGELALDGRLRPFDGLLPCLIAARGAGLKRVVVPEPALPEAALVDGLDVFGATCLSDVLVWLRGLRDLPRPEPVARAAVHSPQPDLADVVGQEDARLACEIAAAGGHHMLLVGPPGTGKTMLARRFAGLLPPLSDDDALTLATIRSIAGRLPPGEPLSHSPPLVAPHPSSSIASLIGGGTGIARPGSVSLAHRGVLFLDEAPELGPKLLDALRTPLEEGEVRIARSEGTVTYPARFQLILAANPCPCAPVHDRDCVCPSSARRRYLARLSGPLLDRVDLHARVYPATTFAGPDGAESSAAVRARVLNARTAAAERWAGEGWQTNAEAPGPALRSRFALPERVVRPLDLGLRSGQLSARSADRALRVAWTLADLAGDPCPSVEQVEAALYFRERRAA